MKIKSFLLSLMFFLWVTAPLWDAQKAGPLGIIQIFLPSLCFSKLAEKHQQARQKLTDHPKYAPNLILKCNFVPVHYFPVMSTEVSF